MGMPVSPALQSAEKERFAVAEESKPAPAPEPVGTEASQLVEAGKVSRWLTENGFEHETMEADHRGVRSLRLTATTCFQWQRRSMLTGLTTFSVNVPMIPDQGKIWSVCIT